MKVIFQVIFLILPHHFIKQQNKFIVEDIICKILENIEQELEKEYKNSFSIPS